MFDLPAFGILPRLADCLQVVQGLEGARHLGLPEQVVALVRDAAAQNTQPVQPQHQSEQVLRRDRYPRIHAVYLT